MELKDIKAIMDLMKKHSVTDLELEEEGFKIKLRRGPGGNGGSDEFLQPVVAVAPTAAVPAAAAPAAPAAPAGPKDPEIKAPTVGTFYRSPSPDSPSFVEVGTEVNPDTVVCIVEAMKVMNEIKAEMHGVITEVLAENTKPVEFGQPLFRVRPK